MRIVVIGNSGGGKSVLARRIAGALGLPWIEVDTLLWLPGWKLVPAEAYDREHARLTAQDRWVIEGLGARDSVPPLRVQCATHIVLIDMPLWMHFWLAAERHIDWVSGRLEHPPAGSNEPAPLKGLFQTIAEVDRDWMPEIRRLADDEEKRGKQVFRLATLEELNSFVPSALGSG
jgi:adenylate kinase family enzyme